MSLWSRVFVLVGSVLLMGGLTLGLTPVESAGSSCGSALVGSDSFYDALVGSTGCSEVRSAVLPWTSAFIVMGVGLAAGGWLLDPERRSTVSAATP